MNTVQLYPQYSKTLELNEKHIYITYA